MRVELDIFSGQPNPGWELTAKESKELIQLFQRLPRDDGGKLQLELGYRGLKVFADSSQITAGFETLVVSNGVVSAGQSGTENQFLDRDRALERWLFLSGKDHIDKSLFNEIAQEVDLD